MTVCTSSDYNKIASAITIFNLEHLPAGSSDAMGALGFTLKQPNADIIGGITGRLLLGNCLSIEILWVEPMFRLQGFATRLLLAIEKEARERGSHLSQVDTFDFQALGFYEKNGYSLFGVLEDCPSAGHKRYYLTKSLL